MLALYGKVMDHTYNKQQCKPDNSERQKNNSNCFGKLGSGLIIIIIITIITRHMEQRNITM